jgi:hypothetical protein
MTFKEYINTRSPKYDEQGDFIRLAKANRALPDGTSWREMSSHMEASGTPSHVVNAGERVWANYLNLVRDQQRKARPATQGGLERRE